MHSRRNVFNVDWISLPFCRYWSLLLCGERLLPPPGDLVDLIRVDRESEERFFARDGRRLKDLTQYHKFMDDLAELINCSVVSNPRYKFSLKRNHWAIYLRVMGSCLSGAQYRLVGPGAKECAWKTVSRLPLPKFRRQPRAAVLLKRKLCRESLSAETNKCSWVWCN